MSTPICTICTDNLIGSSHSGCSALDCGHVFHEDCLDTWNTFSVYCPICKRYIGVECKSRELKLSVKREKKKDSEEEEENHEMQSSISKPIANVSKIVKEYQMKIEEEKDPHERLELLYCSYEELQAYFTPAKRKFTEEGEDE